MHRQDKLLEEVGISPAEALVDFNLGPLNTRRDIAMMGLLHRIVHGAAPKELTELFRPVAVLPFPRCLRNPGLVHTRLLDDPIDGTHSSMMGRSIIGLIYSFNMLPQKIVDMKLNGFQTALPNAAQQAITTQIACWNSLLRSGARTLSLATSQALFT